MHFLNTKQIRQSRLQNGGLDGKIGEMAVHKK